MHRDLGAWAPESGPGHLGTGAPGPWAAWVSGPLGACAPGNVGHQDYPYSIRVLHDGNMMAYTLVLRANKRYHDNKFSWLETGGHYHWENLKFLGHYGVLHIAQEIATFTRTDANVRVDENDLYLNYFAH